MQLSAKLSSKTINSRTVSAGSSLLTGWEWWPYPRNSACRFWIQPTTYAITKRLVLWIQGWTFVLSSDFSLQCHCSGTGKVGGCHLCSDSTFRDSVDSFWSTLGGQCAFICRLKHPVMKAVWRFTENSVYWKLVNKCVQGGCRCTFVLLKLCNEFEVTLKLTAISCRIIFTHGATPDTCLTTQILSTHVSLWSSRRELRGLTVIKLKWSWTWKMLLWKHLAKMLYPKTAL